MARTHISALNPDGTPVDLTVDASGNLKVTSTGGGASGGLTNAELRAVAVPVSGTVAVTDNAGSLTVDGTVTATSDPGDIAPVTPNDATDLPGGVARGYLVGVSGTLRVTTAAGNVRNLVAGQVLAGVQYSLRITRVHATGTTATSIGAYY